MVRTKYSLTSLSQGAEADQVFATGGSTNFVLQTKPQPEGSGPTILLPILVGSLKKPDK